jgi:DNA-binding CsgD family transcriptional regulator/tetratricopeptide (TPR) repeat protein
VLWGSCAPLFAPRPLGPILAVAESVGGELEEVVQGDPMPHDVAGALVRELRRHDGAILVLEDVHWADEATLDVLRLLARRLESVPALVIATYRDDALDRNHPLLLVLGELRTSEVVRRVGLGPLSLDAVAQLAEPRDVDVDELYRKTAGNPFFVVEALAAGGTEIPDLVRDAVLARVATAGAAAKEILDAVALVPPHAELWLLEALVGEEMYALDEAVASGMLEAVAGGVAFRHEIARLAVEESVTLTRKRTIHLKALAMLEDRPDGVLDLARLAHHAEASGNWDAVLRYAPSAAARAASMGAHREAAAQYARALRAGTRLTLEQRAELSERRSVELYLTDASDQAIEAIDEALRCRRALGQRLEVGDSLRWLSQIFWCPGHTVEAELTGREAVAMLEELPPGRELAMAYGNLAAICAASLRRDEAIEWGTRALELAEELEDTEIAVNALATIGACEGGTEGERKLTRSLERAQRANLPEQVGRAYWLLAMTAVLARRHDAATRYLSAGLDYCCDRGLELFRLYLLAYRSLLELDQGRWSDAAESASSALRIQRRSATPRIVSLVVLGLVRARRGEPGATELLNEAWAVAQPTGELPRLGPVAAARAEAAWLEGNRKAVLAAVDDALPLAAELESPLAGELAVWRLRAGGETEIPRGAAPPYALQLAGEPACAAELWRKLDSPYEAALALADSDEEEPLRQALEELHRLEARPAAAIVARRLRELGARGLPRGPRPATRQNPHGLTSRELEVLLLVSEGLRNRGIAERLVLSERTVDRHVGSVLRKLGVSSRVEASRQAVELGLVG